MKKVWRKIFQEFFVGDKVNLPYLGRGTITKKQLKNGVYLYTIRLDKAHEVDEYLVANKKVVFTGRLTKIYEFSGLKFNDLEECK